MKDMMDLVVDQMILDRCRHVEFEVEHHESRAGPLVTRGRMIRPTHTEFGVKALCMWGMIQLAKTIEASGQTVEEWLHGYQAR